MDTATRGIVGVASASAIAASAFFPRFLLIGVILVLALLFSLGWPLLGKLPSPQGSTMVMAVSALLAAGVILAGSRLPYLYYVTLVLVASVVLAFVHEMLRGESRWQVVHSVAGTVAGAFFAVSMTAWVPAVDLPGGLSLVVTAALCLALMQFIVVLPLRRSVIYILAVIIPVGVAIALTRLLTPMHIYIAVVISLAMSVTVLATKRVLRGMRSKTRSWQAGLSVGLMNVAAGGMITYVTARVFFVWLV